MKCPKTGQCGVGSSKISCRHTFQILEKCALFPLYADYLTKPFSVSELVARVKAVFRRIDSLERTLPGARAPIRIGDLELDPTSRTAMLDGEPVSLTAREFDLMLHFARHPNHVFSRAQLLDHVWGYGHEGYEHTVSSHINRLRAKIERDPAHPEFIVTVWGVGYKLKAA